MSTAGEYLVSLRSRGVRVWIDGSQLRYRAQNGSLAHEDLNLLRQLKDGIIVELRKELDEKSQGMSSALATSERIPLTFQQLWLLSLSKRYPHWNCTLCYTLRAVGPLLISSLERSVTSIRRRHRILNGRLVEMDSTLILPTGDAGPGVVKLQPDAREGRSIDELVGKFASRRIDAGTDPLFQVQVIEVSEREHLIFLQVHRIAADCLSVNQLFGELWESYSHDIGANQPEQEGITGQYADYARSQQAGALQWSEKHSGYWSSRLDEATGVSWPDVSLPATSAHTAVDILERRFDAQFSSDLHRVARKSRTLTALIMLTMYATIVARRTGQRDFVVPFNMVGRNSEQEKLIGSFSYPLHLRVQIGSDESLTEVLQNVSHEFYRAMPHQDHGRVSTERPNFLGGTFFQWLAWHPDETPQPEPPGGSESSSLTLRNIPFQQPRDMTTLPPAAVALEMSFFDRADGILASAVYRTDVFTPEALHGLLDELWNLGKDFIHDPGLRALA
jgi:Condensation domain/TubC N-terminal docking domain